MQHTYDGVTTSLSGTTQIVCHRGLEYVLLREVPLFRPRHFNQWQSMST